MKHIYIEYLKDNIRDDLELEAYLVLNNIVSNGKLKRLQRQLRELLNKDISVDGILGVQTILSYSEIVNAGLLDKLVDEYTHIEDNNIDDNDDDISTQYIKNFLFTWEGKVIHWLKGEKGPTTPMGVYCPYHPNTEVCKYLKRLYVKYGLSYNIRTNAYRLNKLISSAERQELYRLALEFYKKKYLNDYIGTRIKKLPKSYLTYFSNSMNANRGVHGIQYAIGAVVDGKLGPKTKGLLNRYISSHSDNDLNNGQLTYIVNRWYCYLAYKSKRRNHFRQFIKGWINRARSLGYHGKGC